MPNNNEVDGRSNWWGYAALIYTVAFMASLWVTTEPEPVHWLTMVAIPLAAILAVGRGRHGRFSLRSALADVGLRWGNLRNWVGWALLLGLAWGVVEFAVAGQLGALRVLWHRPIALFLVPLGFLIQLATAGFTEEFLFRGVLQERLARWWHSDVAALLVASLLFGLYHLPYRYLAADTGASHNLVSSLQDCAVAGLAGLLLGTVYLCSRRNLLASAVCHAGMNTLVMLTMVKVGG